MPLLTIAAEGLETIADQFLRDDLMRHFVTKPRITRPTPSKPSVAWTDPLPDEYDNHSDTLSLFETTTFHPEITRTEWPSDLRVPLEQEHQPSVSRYESEPRERDVRQSFSSDQAFTNRTEGSEQYSEEPPPAPSQQQQPYQQQQYQHHDDFTEAIGDTVTYEETLKRQSTMSRSHDSIPVPTTTHVRTSTTSGLSSTRRSSDMAVSSSAWDFDRYVSVYACMFCMF